MSTAPGYFRVENWSILGTEIEALTVNINHYRKVTAKKNLISSFVYCCPIYLDENRILDETGEVHTLNVKLLTTSDGTFLQCNFELKSACLGDQILNLRSRKIQTSLSLKCTVSWCLLTSGVSNYRLGPQPKIMFSILSVRGSSVIDKLRSCSLRYGLLNSGLDEEVLHWSLNIMHAVQWLDIRFDLQDCPVNGDDVLVLAFRLGNDEVDRYHASFSISEMLAAKQNGRWVSVTPASLDAPTFEIWVSGFNCESDQSLVRLLTSLKNLVETVPTKEAPTQNSVLLTASHKTSADSGLLYLHVMDGLGITTTVTDAKYRVKIEIMTGPPTFENIVATVKTKSADPGKHLVWDEVVVMDIPSILMSVATKMSAGQLCVSLSCETSEAGASENGATIIGFYTFNLTEIFGSLNNPGLRRKEYILALECDQLHDRRNNEHSGFLSSKTAPVDPVRLRVGMLLIPPETRFSDEKYALAMRGFMPATSLKSENKTVCTRADINTVKNGKLKTALEKLRVETAKTEETVQRERIPQIPLGESLNDMERVLTDVERDIRDVRLAVVGAIVLPELGNEEDILSNEYFGLQEEIFAPSPRIQELNMADIIAAFSSVSNTVVVKIAKLVKNTEALVRISASTCAELGLLNCNVNDEADMAVRKAVRLIEIFAGVIGKVSEYKATVAKLSDSLYLNISKSGSYAEVSASSKLLDDHCYR
jgi:hypothetical protein